MNDNGGLLTKLGRWFRHRFSSGEDLPLLHGQTETSTAIVRRPIFGFPRKRREEDLTALNEGLSSIAALMTSLRQYLDQQNARHEELLTYLSQLSNALQSIPDTGRVQGETLRVLHQQIAYQNAQHKQVSEVLRKVSESSGSQQEIAETLRDRVESLYKNDQQISETIENMGASVTVVSQQSQTTSMMLERLRDNLVNRDGELEKAIGRENRRTRGTLMIVGATSLAALVISIAMALYGWSAIARVADSVNVRQNQPTFRDPPEIAAEPVIAQPAPVPSPGLNPAPIILPSPASTQAADQP